MQFILTGFTQETGFRVFAFEGVVEHLRFGVVPAWVRTVLFAVTYRPP